MSIRKLAKAWMRVNYPNEPNNEMRASRYHPQGVWFFTLPTSYFDMNNPGHVNFLLQFEKEPTRFHYLKVPFEFLRNNQTKFAIRNSGISFDLHISAKQSNWLIDERSRGVGFNEFQQNAGRRTARTTHAEWHKILKIAPDSSIEDIRRAYRLRMSEYHPDKVAHLGEKIRDLAEQESKKINAAYEEASRQRQGR